ncbi:MAG: ClpXP protease specificity-enhancing factor [Spongiibacteraceae bacterium]
MDMTPSRPYIVRALYEWILENDCTPYILVNAMANYVEVPQQFVKNGQIVLNVSPTAVRDLVLTNEMVQFNGRFSGVPMNILVPMTAVLGIYARENGQGMMFDYEEPSPDPKPPSGAKLKGIESTKQDSAAPKSKAGLRVVK